MSKNEEGRMKKVKSLVGANLYSSFFVLHSAQTGQMLVGLVVFMAVAMTLTTSAIAITLSSIQASSKYSLGQGAYATAESGAEEAMLRIIRNPSYTTGGLSLTVGNGSANVTVTGATSPKTITSIGTFATSQRTIQVTVTVVNNVVTITSWKEI